MNTRNWLAVAFSALAVATFSMLGGAYIAPHAHAQSLAPGRVTSAVTLRSATSSGFNICLSEAKSECIISHGGDAQVTIDTSDYAVFYIVHNGAGFLVQLQDAGGKCLRSYADDTVGLAFGACSSSTTAEWWNLNPEARSTLYQYDNPPGSPPLYMGTYGKGSGNPVYMAETQQGFYWGWSV